MSERRSRPISRSSSGPPRPRTPSPGRHGRPCSPATDHDLIENRAPGGEAAEALAPGSRWAERARRCRRARTPLGPTATRVASGSVDWTARWTPTRAGWPRSPVPPAPCRVTSACRRLTVDIGPFVEDGDQRLHGGLRLSPRISLGGDDRADASPGHTPIRGPSMGSPLRADGRRWGPNSPRAPMPSPGRRSSLDRGVRAGDVPLPRHSELTALNPWPGAGDASRHPAPASGARRGGPGASLTDGRFDPRVLADLDRLGYRGAPLAERARTRGSGTPDRAVRRVRTGASPCSTRPIDLGGIGKGLAPALGGRGLARGVADFLLEAGGDLVARAAGPVRRVHG